jgi:hypothetical protein
MTDGKRTRTYAWCEIKKAGCYFRVLGSGAIPQGVPV